MRFVVDVPKLLDAMTKKGMQEKDMANLIGLSTTQVYRVIRGLREPGNEFIAGVYHVFEDVEFKKIFLLKGAKRQKNRKESAK